MHKLAPPLSSLLFSVWLGGCTKPETPRVQSSTPAATPVAVEQQSLSDYAARLEGRHAAGYYVGGVRVGYLIYQLKRVPVPLKIRGFAPGDEQLLEETVESEMRMEMMGKVTRNQEKTRLYYSMRGDGPLVWAECDSVQDENEEHLLVRHRGDKHEVWVDGKLARIVPESQMTLSQTRRVEGWLVDTKRQSGDTTQTYEAEWKETPVDHPSTITYKGRGQASWREKPLTVYDVALEVQGLVLEGQVTRHLLPLKASAGGMIDIRLEEEGEARKLGGVARWTDWGLPVDRRLSNPQQVRRLRLLAESSLPLKLPQNHRQTVTQRGEKWEIALAQEVSKPQPEPLALEARKRALKPDYTTEVNPVMAKLAHKVTASAKTTASKAAALQAWVYHYLQSQSIGQALTAQDIFRIRKGDCTEHSLLFVALAKACGIPARLAHGVMYVDGQAPCFGWHQWAEIYDGTGWVGVDPTWNQYGIDATHLKFGNDTRDLSSFNQIGRMKLQVLEVK